MKISLLTVLTLFFFQTLQAQYYFPPSGSEVWETTPPADLGWCEEKLDSLYQFLESNNTKAFLILKDGRIVVEEYFNGHGRDSVWYWASAGKTLTAFLVGVAEQEGSLNLDDPTSDYLGEGWTSCPPEKEDLITVRHQLTMTSGMDDSQPDCLTPDCLQYVADAGTRWAYHNASYRLLYAVTEAATGLNYNIFTLQRLLQPTGMSGLWLLTPEQTLFFSKARSMARFGSLIINGGSWNGNQLLTNPDYVEAMTTPSQALNESYGYLWWLNGQESFMIPGVQFMFPGMLDPNGPADMYSALGKNGQFLDVIPSENMVVVRMGDAPENSFISLNFHRDMWAKISDLACETTAAGEAAAPNMGVEVMPNPFRNNLRISGLTEAQSYQLVDANGNVVADGYSPLLPTWHLPAGTYFLRVNENGKVVETKPLVKR